MKFDDWDHRCMALALDEARRAADRGEVPVGAVLTRGTEVLAHCGNGQIDLNDPTAHAEIRASERRVFVRIITGSPRRRCMSRSSPARCAVAHWYMLAWQTLYSRRENLVLEQ